VWQDASRSLTVVLEAMMRIGRYFVRASWTPVGTGDRFLAKALIDFEEDGIVFVYVNGEPLFAFPHAEAFFAAHTISPQDLEPARAPRLARASLLRAPQRTSYAV